MEKTHRHERSLCDETLVDSGHNLSRIRAFGVKVLLNYPYQGCRGRNKHGPEGAKTGFPRRLENLENENGHGKVMEHEKIAKNQGIL